MANILVKKINFINILKQKNFSKLSLLHCCNTNVLCPILNNTKQWKFTLNHYTDNFSRNYCNKKSDIDDEKKLSLIGRIKKMYKEYWYVLVPVHLVTSTVWFGGFYYLAKSGVDIVSFLESWNVSEKITNPLKDSSMGYIAISYALYKIATPARYTVTLGGTTISINYLKKWGYIKPVPSREKLIQIYEKKKEDIIVTMREKKQGLRATSVKIKDKKSDFVEKLDDNLKKFKEVTKKHSE